MNDTAFEQIKRSSKVPTPTGVAPQAPRLPLNEDCTVQQIPAAVEADLAIASRLLKLVNAPPAVAEGRHA